MRISHRNGKFESALGGTYTMLTGKTYLDIDFASAELVGEIAVTEKVEGNKLVVKGTLTRPDAKTMTWEDVFERLEK